MGIAPQKPIDRITFYQNRTSATGAFKLNATAIGTTTVAVDALNALADAALAAWQEQQAKKDAAKIATQNFRLALNAVSSSGSDIIKAIKAKAAVSGDGIYTLADLPAPATPSPVPPPGKPADFKAAIEASGALSIGWKCSNPRSSVGTTYLIARQIGGAEFVILGATGQKRFTDATLPANAGPVTYRVIAQRSTAQGLPAEFTVKFGTGAAGETTAAVVAAAAPKLAA